jgi:hypothetical protein
LFPSSEMYGVNLYKVNCHLQWLLQIKPQKIGGWSEFELKFYISNLIENREQSYQGVSKKKRRNVVLIFQHCHIFSKYNKK